jgi:hypothetical protein
MERPTGARSVVNNVHRPTVSSLNGSIRTRARRRIGAQPVALCTASPTRLQLRNRPVHSRIRTCGESGHSSLQRDLTARHHRRIRRRNTHANIAEITPAASTSTSAKRKQQRNERYR